MTQFLVADIKPHLSVPKDDTDNDGIIQGFIAAAEAWVVVYLRRDLDTEFPNRWPEPVRHAVQMIVALWFHNREGVSEGGMTSEVPFGVKDMLAPFRDMGA
ncbi:phage gp6-like head-tail connector protein [Sedimentitalea sp. CY04]|uniref:Phage gp6-like head-tail connector protein n=1 Tax=Parasedimentitalea denitrificans TaxID=2211118 RepID=A0ABX0WCU9_9RHOB|nr:phage gp6-like head-tail connector protein [Sedimentitalea sp. CY04]